MSVVYDVQKGGSHYRVHPSRVISTSRGYRSAAIRKYQRRRNPSFKETKSPPQHSPDYSLLLIIFTSFKVSTQSCVHKFWSLVQ